MSKGVKVLIGLLSAQIFVGSFLCGRWYEQEIWLNYLEKEKIKIETKDYIEYKARKLARKHNINEELVLSIMWQESRWNPNSKSKAGAMGLMQLMPATAKDMEVTDPYDIHQNIEGGIKYLKWLFERDFKDPTSVLIAYNWGIKNAKKYEQGKINKLPKETEQYIQKVSKWANEKPWTCSENLCKRPSTK